MSLFRQASALSKGGLVTRLIRGTMARELRGAYGRVVPSAARAAVSYFPTERSDDPLLLTPGPLTSSLPTKQAMLRDVGSRDKSFISVVRDVRDRLVEIAVPDDGKRHEYTAVLLQGSGTFSVEATLSCALPHEDALAIILTNGSYGTRMASMCKALRIPHREIAAPEGEQLDTDALRSALAESPKNTVVAMVHCETSTGMVNDISRVSQVVNDAGATFVVDAMSSFGAYDIDMSGLGIDFMISSANKCLEGVPGFAFVLARTSALEATRGNARSLSFDLLAQYEGLEASGQFRFTPPTHTILAFDQALREFQAEGGIGARQERYAKNNEIVRAGMKELGFDEFLDPTHQSHIITSYAYPKSDKFDFVEFYDKLAERNFVIYPGKVTNSPTFRIGNIGRLFPQDMEKALDAVREVKEEMGF